MFFKYSLNNKNSISFSHVKFLFSLFFSQKMMVIFSFLLLRPTKSSGALKKDPTFGLLTFEYTLKTRPWGNLFEKIVLYLMSGMSNETESLFSLSRVLISFLCHAEAIQKCKNKLYLYQWHKSKLLFFLTPN